jgi:adenylate cyclase
MAQDEAATIRTLTAYRDQIGALVREHRGSVVDSPGDNIMAQFPTALDAVQGAVEIQRVIQARNADLPVQRQMEFRIGVHLGDVSVEGDRLYGDGVNIAARLEGLAGPGGICISGTVYEQVQRKLDFEYEDLGKQELKNIPDAVQTYRLRFESEVSIPTDSLPGMDDLTVPGFGGRPAIAILPFDNMSGDPEQNYLADGLAEDLITRLSALRSYPVIARNSSFVYKGRAVDLKQVSRELGVRYAVEGSVRKAGKRIRVSAQLVDATTGHHVWAETYDRELDDIFALQDEITKAIVASMTPGLVRFELERAARREPKSLDAWDCMNRAFWHLAQVTREDNEKAQVLLEKAARLDPHLVGAFYGLASIHHANILLQWADSPARSMEKLDRAARKCVELDHQDSLSHQALGLSYSIKGQREKAIASFELAIHLNPSNPTAYHNLGFWLAMTGKGEDAIMCLQKGMRLSPHDTGIFFSTYSMALAYFALGRYEEAVDWALRSVQRRPGHSPALRVIAASYAYLGRLDEARVAAQELLRVEPGFSLVGWEGSRPDIDTGLLKQFLEGLSKAGLK